MDAVVDVAVEAVDLGEVSCITVGGDEDTVEEAMDAAAAAGFVGAEGEEKNDVMEALAFGFLVVEVATSAALRLSGVAIAYAERESVVELTGPMVRSRGNVQKARQRVSLSAKNG